MSVWRTPQVVAMSMTSSMQLCPQPTRGIGAAAADAHEAVVLRAQILTVAIQQIGVGRVRDDARLGLQAARVVGVRRIAVPQLVIGAEHEHAAAVLDAIREARRRMEHLERRDRRRAEADRLVERARWLFSERLRCLLSRNVADQRRRRMCAGMTPKKIGVCTPCTDGATWREKMPRLKSSARRNWWLP